MHEPVVLAAQQAAQAAVARDNAARVLRPGTVVDSDPTTCLCTVTMDGDTDPIDVLNACGGFLWAGDRVLVQFQPPHGAYAVYPLQPLDPMFMIIAGTTVPVPSDAVNLTALPFDPATMGGHDDWFTATTTSVKIGFPGRYSILAGAAIDPNGTGHRLIELFVNGTVRIQGDTKPAPPSSVETDWSVEWRTFLAAGDTVQFRVRHTAGVALNARLYRSHWQWLSRL